jgi:hypothetical protein
MGKKRDWCVRISSLIGACALVAGPTTLSSASTTHHASRPAGVWQRNGWLSPRNERLSSRIFSDKAALQREGVYLTQWGPDSVTGKTEIYLTHYSRARAQILYKRYGNGIIVSTISTPRPHLQNRGSDTSPYAGGDNLWIPAVNGFCTSGPIAETSSGSFVMITAGHCTVAAGNFIYRSSPAKETNGPHIGNVTNRVNCDGCVDVSIVNHDSSGSTYRASVWGGAPGDSSAPQYSEDGTSFPQPGNCANNAPTGCAGDLVTADSAFTGEVRGITVFKVNQSVVIITDSGGTVTTRALSMACSTVVNPGSEGFQCENSGPTIGQAGDSGGPWIVHEGSSNNVQIAGTTVAGNGFIQYYEQIGDTLSTFNLSIP